MKFALATALVIAVGGARGRTQSTASEASLAARNGSFVPSAEPALQRRLLAGLEELRKGDVSKAVELLLPQLSALGDSPQLAWSERETRDFELLLAQHIARLDAKAKSALAKSFEKDASAALANAGLDEGVLARIAQRFPGTASAQRARRMLADLAIERGDWVAAAGRVAWLGDAERKRRASALATLERHAFEGSEWPLPAGGFDGLPCATIATRPRAELPKRLCEWQTTRPWESADAAGVVGRNREGQRVAVWQDPRHLLTLVDSDAAPSQVQSLRKISGRPPALARRCGPCMLGARLFVVHGGRGTIGEEHEDVPEGGAELLAFEVVASKPELRWRYKPEGAKALGKRAVVQPFVVACGSRVFVLAVERQDRLNYNVSLLALDDLGKSARLRWTRRLASGAALTAGLLTHRQESLRAGRVRPASMVLASGRLFVETGLGVVCCVEAESGRVLWTFKTARLPALGGSDEPWREARICATPEHVHIAPSDAVFSYSLHRRPGLADRLAALPEHKRSRTRFFGIAPKHGASYWLREGLQERAPMRLLLATDKNRPARYDAPPLQFGEELHAAALLTEHRVVVCSDRSVYWIDLGKDLFYEQLCPLERLAARSSRPPKIAERGSFGPALPWRGGIVIAGADGAWAWH